MGVRRDTLEELRGKYDAMLAMRLLHESGEEDAAEVRGQMAELAARFPGALREIDDLELDVLRKRIAALDAVIEGGSPVERWMEAVALFHRFARGVLWAKRWLGGRKSVDETVRREFASYASVDGASDALAWAADLQRVAAPPRGRLTDLVFARVAESLGTTEAEARHLVFGVPRRKRTNR